MRYYFIRIVIVVRDGDGRSAVMEKTLSHTVHFLLDKSKAVSPDLDERSTNGYS